MICQYITDLCGQLLLEDIIVYGIDTGIGTGRDDTQRLKGVF